MGLLGPWLIQLPGDTNPVSVHTSTLLGAPEPAALSRAPLGIAWWELLLFSLFLFICLHAFSHHGFYLG